MLRSELKYIAEQRIQRVEKAKLLGLVIDSSLSWTEHINTIVNRIGCDIINIVSLVILH